MSQLAFFERFCEEILPRLNDADLIKLMLYIHSMFSRQEGQNHYLFTRQILQSATLQNWMGGMNIDERISQALKTAIDQGLLISGKHPTLSGKIMIFSNDETGQAAWKNLQEGLWQPAPTDHPVETQQPAQKNIFQLYEENIGPLTPLLSDDLAVAQKEYPINWIIDAFRVAVQNNARSWRYIDTVLKSWQKEGKNVQSRRNSETAESRRNESSEFDDFVQH